MPEHKAPLNTNHRKNERTKSNKKNSLVFNSFADFKQDQGINLQNIFSDLEWLKEVINLRINDFESKSETTALESDESNPLPILQEGGNYNDFINENKYGLIERLLVSIAILSNTDSEALNVFNKTNPDTFSPYSIFGGATLNGNQRFYPTLKTILFLLSGGDKKKDAYYRGILESHPMIFSHQIISLKQWIASDENIFDQIIYLDPAYLSHFYSGKEVRLDQTENFPATLFKTDKTWEDLILSQETKDALTPITDYINGMKQYDELKGKVKPGHIALFYGLPGTGKTLTASVLGKQLGVDTYVVNLSRVISKYIGETEKNLDRIFERLGNTNNILFFDEADALFGKRSEVKEAKDRYANQEVAYLLQRIESCHCLVILASNFRQNMDDAFRRRILTDIPFMVPTEVERVDLWKHGLPDSIKYETEDLPVRLANRYSITGANVANILKLACFSLLAKPQEERIITSELLSPIIQKEYIKESRNVNMPHAWPNYQ